MLLYELWGLTQIMLKLFVILVSWHGDRGDAEMPLLCIAETLRLSIVRWKQLCPDGRGCGEIPV